MSSRQLVPQLHARAVENLRIKLKILPPRIFTRGKPTIIDIYHAINTDPGDKQSKLHVDGIPNEIQLEYFFANYNELATYQFIALQAPAPLNVAAAPWFYQTDQGHSFSKSHRCVKYNILLMLMISASSDSDAYKSTEDFRGALIRAWWEAMSKPDDFTHRNAFIQGWHTSDIDLIWFRNTQLFLMASALKQASSSLPQLPCSLDEFLMKARENPNFLRTHGTTWALRMLSDTVPPSVKGNEQAKKTPGGGVAQSTDVDMAENSPPDFLTDAHFDTPLLRSLLTYVPPLLVDVKQPSPRLETQNAWMNTYDAVGLFQRKMSAPQSLADLFANIQL
ncbi:hypothetical protein CC80DRAFT_561036 [Byssothecium circinans]|uniref:Uncharacterized protein n=1 Tax=Byssothecium circinans TaxID=147558 RepID=A0A6A5U102_9PLEO|nr:hypothetical protein CC80DRAFT_561036 [Byssothecium circinans]